MPDLTTDFLYLLDQKGGSDNAKVVRELVPDSTATSTEQTPDGTLVVGEQFSTEFASLDVQGRFGTTFTYIGNDPDFPGAVAMDSLGNFYLFSDDGTIPIGATMNGIVAEPIILCFLAGTMIACPDGERAVETLAIGDLILTVEGYSVPVMWIGRQTVITLFGPPEGRRPVCITAGALGDNLPTRDLRLTSDHALLIDGVLVQAGALINDSTIRRLSLAELGERYTTYHIETENHEIVLAEGAPAETFIDNVSRRLFDNYAEFELLYGDETPIIELDQPRAMSARQVPRAIRERLAALATALGHGAEVAA